jgi:hypothetical protein
MPSWKKVIVSGSDASLNSLIVNSGVTGSLQGTASYANNADLLDGKDSTIFATTGSNTFIGSQTVTGSLSTSGSNTLIGNTILSGSIIISGSTGPGAATASVQIYGDIRQTGYHRFDSVTTNIDTSVSASYIYVSGSTNDLYFSQNGSGYNNVTRLRWIEGNLYTGLLNGGLITATIGSTTYQISSGSGIIVNLNASLSDNPYPVIQYLNWGNLTGSISAFTSSFQQIFVGIDSTNNIFAQGTPFSNGQFDTVINIGGVFFQNGSTINAVKTQPSVAYGFEQQQNIFNRAFGALKLSGYTLAQSGSSTGSLIVGSGTAYAPGSNYAIDPNEPSYTVDSGTNISKIFRYYQSGSSWVYLTNGGAGYAAIDPANYSNNGTLTPVPGTGINRQWSIQRVFWFPNSVVKAIVVYYGNETYTTEADAIANIPFESFVEAPNTAANAVYLGAIIVRNNADFTDLTSYKIQPGGLFRQVGGSGGGGSTVTQTLSGLSDVLISGPTSGQALVYDTTAAKWENKSFLSASISGNAATATSSSVANSATSASFASTASYVANVVYTTGSQSISGLKTFTDKTTFNNHTVLDGSGSNNYTLAFKQPSSTLSFLSGDYTEIGAFGSSQLVFSFGQLPSDYKRFTFNVGNLSLNTPRTYQFPDKTGTLLIDDITTGSVATASLAFTSSYTLNAVSASYAATASSADNFLVRGTLTAQTIVAQTITSSTDFVTGSTRFGSLQSNTHQFTGSVSITGSLNVVGTGITGSLLGTASRADNATSASYALVATSASYALTASYTPSIAGTTNYIAKFTDGSTIGNSQIFDDGTYVGIGTTNPAYKLHTVTSATSIAAFRNSDAALGQILVGNTVADLALRILSSGDALIFSDTSKYLAFGSNGGTERMRLDTSGNVGIGTTAPLTKLEVYNATEDRHFSAIGAAPSINFGNVNSAPSYYGTLGLATTTNNFIQGAIAGDLAIVNRGNISGSILFGIGQSTGNEKMRITPTGNVGIGTSSPGQKLDVWGTFRVTGSATTLASFESSGTNAFIGLRDSSGDYVYLGNDDGDFLVQTPTSAYSTKLIVKDDGNVGIGTTNPSLATLQIQGNVSASSYTGSLFGTASFAVSASWAPGGGASLSGGSTNYIARWASSTTLTTGSLYDDGTNVGIGTTNPVVKLEIIGDIRQKSLAGNSQGFNITNNSSTDVVSLTNYYNAAMTFGTNNTERMRIASDGNVGIGTTSPSATLDLYQSSGTTSIKMVSAGIGSKTYLLTSQLIGVSNGGFGIQNQTDSRYELVINANGNVGIGTTSPSRPIHAYITTGPVMRLQTSGSNAAIEFAPSLGTGNGLFNWLIGAQYNVSNAFEITPSTAINGSTFSTPALVVTSGGNVGIGTTSPSNKFVVSNAGASGLEIDPTGGVSSGVLLQAYNRSTSAYMAQSYYALSHTFNVGSGGGTRALDITSAGNVGIGTTSPSTKLEVNGDVKVGSYLYMASEGAGTVIGDISTGNYLRFLVSNSEKMYITSGGNVGIGTSSPSSTLDINGDLEIKNAYYNAYSSSVSGTTTLATIPTSSYNAVFFDFVAFSGSNQRAGTLIGNWRSGNVQYTEYSSPDIGATSAALTMSVALSGANALVQSVSAPGWAIKATYRTV